MSKRLNLYQRFKNYYKNRYTPEDEATIVESLKDPHNVTEVQKALDQILEEEEGDTRGHEYRKEALLNRIKGNLDVSEQEKELNSILRVHQDKTDDKRRRHTGRVLLKIAASVVILVASTWFAMDLLKESYHQSTGIANTKEIKTTRGQFKVVSLPDGSHIRLNGSSHISFNANFAQQAERVVYLEGEAFFEVSENPDKPFVVYTRDIRTKVLGTSFNINAYQQNDNISIAVKTGKVEVKKLVSDEFIFLTPNDMAVWKDQVLIKSTFDPELVFGWKDRILVFKNAGFSEIVSRLEEWYNVDFEVNGEFFNEGYSAKYQNESLETVLRGLSFAGKFHYKIDEDRVILKSNN